ncbi:MAG: Crp/Fnr family transcriptional regulator [Rubrobacter sp.]|jgi:CRP/FNR family transcriptional regulator|nr:Crp/Fnr family transcriptional regulator [Rubrobacter sp.]
MLLPKEKIRLLSMVDVLEPLSEDELEELGRRIPDTHVERDRIFYTPEDRSEALFMLKRGRVRIYKVTPDGWEFTLAMVEAGTMFGEMALTAQRLREAYAEATEPSDICVLKREDLERLVRGNPDVGLRMIRVLSERLRLCETRLEDIGLKDIPARLAKLILQLAEGEGVMTSEGPRIPTHYTHRQLATMIGASRESVTRAFTRLRRAGAVELRRRRIYVKDVAVLERAAG